MICYYSPAPSLFHSNWHVINTRNWREIVSLCKGLVPILRESGYLIMGNLTKQIIYIGLVGPDKLYGLNASFS